MKVKETVTKEIKEKGGKPSHFKKFIIYGVALILFVIATNPSILFFLSDDVKENLQEIWSGVFGGDVTGITKTVVINWISIFKVVGIILVLSVIYHFIKFILSLIKIKTNKGKSIHSMFNSVLFYGIALIGIIWCLSAIGINLSTIFASIGLVALVIGFAAESLIEDVITGIFLVFEDEYNVGDIIEFNGFRGTVTSIGVRVTCIEDVGGNVKVVNNSDIRNILNRSKAKSFASCIIPISYDADLEATEEILKEILMGIPEKYPAVFQEPIVYSGVQELAESGVNLKVVAHVNETDIYQAPRLIYREVKIGFDKMGVEIPFNQVVIHNADK